jgi:serine/threonine-protein kinase SRPK3
VLKEKYLMDPGDADVLASFLMPMLHYYPDSRATAAELVKHPWLSGVIVEGEEVMAERERRASEGLGTGGEAGGSAQGQDGQEADTKVEGKEEKKGKGKGTSALEEVLKLGPAVKGLVGMGRI